MSHKLLVATYQDDLQQLEMFCYCLDRNWQGNRVITVVLNSSNDWNDCLIKTEEIVKQYPMVKDLVNFDLPDEWYVKTSPTGRNSNMYMPEERNDIYEYNKQWFFYKNTRDKMRGGNIFKTLWDSIVYTIKEIL